MNVSAFSARTNRTMVRPDDQLARFTKPVRWIDGQLLDAMYTELCEIKSVDQRDTIFQKYDSIIKIFDVTQVGGIIESYLKKDRPIFRNWHASLEVAGMPEEIPPMSEDLLVT